MHKPENQKINLGFAPDMEILSADPSMVYRSALWESESRLPPPSRFAYLLKKHPMVLREAIAELSREDFLEAQREFYAVIHAMRNHVAELALDAYREDIKDDGKVDVETIGTEGSLLDL